MLIGYDEFGKSVHIMAVTSDGEVHDHACRWKAQELACDRYKGGLGTIPVTEDLSVRVDGKTLVMNTSMFSEGKPLASMVWKWRRK